MLPAMRRAANVDSRQSRRLRSLRRSVEAEERPRSRAPRNDQIIARSLRNLESPSALPRFAKVHRYRFARGSDRVRARATGIGPLFVIVLAFSGLSLFFRFSSLSYYSSHVSSPCRRENVVDNERPTSHTRGTPRASTRVRSARGISNGVRYFRILRNYERERSLGRVRVL